MQAYVAGATAFCATRCCINALSKVLIEGLLQVLLQVDVNFDECSSCLLLFNRRA